MAEEETPKKPKAEAAETAETAERGPAVRLGKAIWLEQYRQEQQESNPGVKRKELPVEQRKAMTEQRQSQWKEQRKPFVTLARRVLKQLEKEGYTLAKKA